MNNLNMNMMNNPNLNMIDNLNIMDSDNMNKFEDVYPYIKDNKIEIILKGINNKRYENHNNKAYILIPISLKKNELYYLTARKFSCEILDGNIYSEIKLYHNNKLLNDDDTSIEFILNGDTICVKSDTNFNSLYYQSILEIYKDSLKINAIFQSSTGFKLSRVFPNNISIKQMFKTFFKEMNLEKNKINSLVFLYDGNRISPEDDRILKNELQDNSYITFYNTKDIVLQKGIHNHGAGKVFEVSIENNKGITLNFMVGTLEQISDFRKRLNEQVKELKFRIINNPILYPGNIEVKEDCERTFSSIGIRDDCICKVNLSEI